MKTTMAFAFVVMLVGEGCAGPSAGFATVGAATAGAAGAAVLGHGSPLAAAAGGLAGGTLAAYSTSAEQRAYQRGLDDGYLLGASDAAKRLYWVKQASEKPLEDPSGVSMLRELLEKTPGERKETTP